MHLVWGMMNNLQLIGTMLKFNVDVPPNTYIFFKYLDDFLSMKAQFVEDYLEKFNQLFIPKKSQSSGSEGDKDSNSSVIKNIGTIILSVVGLFLAMIVTAILIRYSKNPRIQKITDSLKQKLFYNSLLRTCVQSYLKFSIIAFASLDNSKDSVTLATGLFFSNFCLFFLLFVHSYLRIKRSSLKDPAFSSKFDSLYMNLDLSKDYSTLLTTLFLARRFFLGVLLSYCDYHQSAQFIYMNLTSVGLLVYLIIVKPMVSSYLNFIEIFNEVILYGCTNLIAGMTDYTPDREIGVTDTQFTKSYNDKQNQIGLAYIVLACITIAVTFGGIIFSALYTSFLKAKRWFLRRKSIKAPLDKS